MPVIIHPRPSLEAATRLLESASLPSSDLTEAHMEHFFFCGLSFAPTGLAGFEVCGPDALLRSLVVVPDHRAQGVGKQLVAHVECEARARGVKAIYLLTTTAEAFFARCGYGTSERAQAPEGIRATREFSGLCPATSAFMTKRL